MVVEVNGGSSSGVRHDIDYADGNCSGSGRGDSYDIGSGSK